MSIKTKSNRDYNNAMDRDMRKLIDVLHQSGEAKTINLVSSQLELPSYVQTNAEFVKYVQQINAFQMIFGDLKNFYESEMFDCIFFTGNTAWIERNQIGNYRYFTKSQRAVNAIGYTVIDILKAILCEGSKDYNSGRLFLYVRRKLAYLLQVNYMEFEWERKQILKYEQNSVILENLFKYDHNTFRLLSMKKILIDVLHLINEKGIGFLPTIEQNFLGEALFSIPYKDLSDSLGYKMGEIYKAIEQANVLGLIKLINSNDKRLPEKLFRKFQSNTYFTFFAIPHYSSDLLSKAEETLQMGKRNQ